MSEYCKNCEVLQQENEKLKEKWNTGFQKFCDKDNELQAEREKVKKLENRLSTVKIITGRKGIKNLLFKCDKYKQALDEIEKILRDAHRFNTYCEDDRTQTDVRAFNNERILTVLDIISKAKGEE